MIRVTRQEQNDAMTYGMQVNPTRASVSPGTTKITATKVSPFAATTTSLTLTLQVI